MVPETAFEVVALAEVGVAADASARLSTVAVAVIVHFVHVLVECNASEEDEGKSSSRTGFPTGSPPRPLSSPLPSNVFSVSLVNVEPPVWFGL